MNNTPKGVRLHIAILGRRNAGKSSILNRLTRQNTSIVSSVPGTTTDPVEKPMELLPLGPVLFIDTAGIDDEGTLGELRIARTMQVLDRTEVALLVVDLQRTGDNDPAWSDFEQRLAEELTQRNIPFVVVFNKYDRIADSGFSPAIKQLCNRLTDRKIPFVCMGESASSSANLIPQCLSASVRNIYMGESGNDSASDSPVSISGLGELKETLVRIAPESFLTTPAIVSDLVPPGSFVVLVVPIDKEAPKGRLILPQVQTIRDLLDGDCGCIVVKENMLEEALRRMTIPPQLVVTDSQAFAGVSKIVPDSIYLTSFSILFARLKGDLGAMIAGAKSMEQLSPKAKILIAEACTHHPIAEDIGTEKIPRMLRKRFGESIEFSFAHGHDFPKTPEELRRYDLVIHCGACMYNRREMLCRIGRCQDAGVAITNYGLAIAWLTGILDRAATVLMPTVTPR